MLALDGVDLAVDAGEVLAVVGENGAGKSTLMKILAGVLQPDAGSIEIGGDSVRFPTVSDAQAHGIALIHQELCLCDRLDVCANVTLGRESRRPGLRRFGLLDRRRNEERARRALERVGLDVDVRASLEELSIGERQRVEIAKAIDADARVLIMDEPTSSLTLHEVERLFDLVRELAAAGTSIVYISHRLREVEELANRAVVLRDGRVVAELEGEAIEHARLAREMVGRDVDRFFSRHAHPPGDSVLRVRGLATAAFPDHRLDLTVRAGEVVALAGLVGAGRSELLRALALVDRPLAGRIEVTGRALDPGVATVADATSAGLALVPEDRQREGLFLTERVRRNLSIAHLRRHAGLGFVLDRDGERRLAARAMRDSGIKAPNDREAVERLSGGNQQKVVLGRAFAGDPAVLCLDEPTRGVDVGAKAEIYALIDELARRGCAVLFASSEMEEVLGLADRCLVLHEGAIVGELGREELTEEAVMLLATGAGRAA